MPWLTARASKLSLRPRPRMCECAPRRIKKIVEMKQMFNKLLPIRSIRVISRTC